MRLHTRTFVGGRWVESRGDLEHLVTNPATEQALARVVETVRVEVS